MMRRVRLLSLAASMLAPMSAMLAQFPGGPGGFGGALEDRKLVMMAAFMRERGGDTAGFAGRGGPPGGGGGPPGGMVRGGVDLDPLVGMADATKPLRSKLLAVPALRAKYVGHFC